VIESLLAAERPEYVAFTVYGEAKPGGSKKGFVDPRSGRVVVVEDSKNKPWRREVAAAGLRAIAVGNEAEQPHFPSGALAVEFTFFRPRPLGHYGTGRHAGRVKPTAPLWPTTRPDVLKLARAVEDALTGVVWHDDSQIVDERLRKCYGEPERVEIGVWRVA
jgi:Holliday junction resolvase RusA-like endonuclease